VSDVDLYVAAMVLTNPSGIMAKPQHHSDRTGVDIAVVNVPAFLSVVWGSAAGEFGHTTLKRGT
jgi:hypothetical protein